MYSPTKQFDRELYKELLESMATVVGMAGRHPELAVKVLEILEPLAEDLKNKIATYDYTADDEIENKLEKKLYP